jgi:tRNA(Ile)-lysidine synthase
MHDKRKNIFSSTFIGEAINIAIEKAISEHNMLEKLKKGVLVGLSGGADSVLLLLYLVELRKKVGDFPILAVHINHMIRGKEADRDEIFSKEFSESLGVPIICIRVDVPKIAAEESLSIEEAARNARYSEFQNIIRGREDISCIALAHNATDNIETVLFNVLRGTGTRGAAGIPPVRDNILRPLIFVPKKDIIWVLDDASIEYMTDSTNMIDDYSRNYIRNNILPPIHKISCDPERSFSRLSRNLRMDDDYIMEQAEVFLRGRKRVSTKELASIHKSLLRRVLSMMAAEYSIMLENAHIDSIYNCLSKDSFEIYLPENVRFVSERGISYMTNSTIRKVDYFYYIDEGKNILPEYNSDFYLTDEKVNESSLNVYKKSIQADLSSAIICGRLFIRPKQDGDVVFYGGMTHKLKKLFNDRKVPVSNRPLIPILCDDKGVVWVPGYGVRDDAKGDTIKPLYATLAIRESDADECYSFCFAERNKQSSTGK